MVDSKVKQILVSKLILLKPASDDGDINFVLVQKLDFLKNILNQSGHAKTFKI